MHQDEHTGYSLAISAWAEVPLRPVQVTGSERLMGMYRFDTEVVVPGTVASGRLDLDQAIGSPVVLRILKQRQPPLAMSAANAWPIHGIVARITHRCSGADGHRFRLTVMPELVRLSSACRTRVWRNQTVQDIVLTLCREAGLTAPRWRATVGGERRSCIVQHQETDLAFSERLCARLGIWYLFRFEDGATALEFQDQQPDLPRLPDPYPLRAASRDPVGAPADPWDMPEMVQALETTRQLVPGAVTVRGWDPHAVDPHPEGSVQAAVASPLPGDFRYGCQAPERGREFGRADEDKAGQPGCALLARLLAERHALEHRTGGGRSTIRNLRAGQVLTVQDGATARQLLVVGVDHHGQQGAGGHGTGGRQDLLSYRNRFTAIPHDERLPYRPAERPWPQVPGLVTAQVESQGGAADPYADLDDQGRYRVRLAADRGNPGDAKGSLPVRMLTPSSGQAWGFHLPLHHGAEVLLAHVDGDPDRPVIAGAVPNATSPSVVTQENRTRSRLVTAGGNELMLDDQQGGERIRLQARKDLATEVGNDETRAIAHDQEQRVGRHQRLAVAADRHETIGGDCRIAVGGSLEERVGGGRSETVQGGSTLHVGQAFSVTVGGDHGDQAQQGRSISARTIRLRAEDEIILSTGGAVLSLKKNGDITITGRTITIAGSGAVVVKGSGIRGN